MYAVIQTGGKQYRVSPGDLLVVDKLEGQSGDEIAFDAVLLIGEGPAVTVGAPLVAGASVSATLVETRKGKKIKVFKKIRRQGYRRTRGHRQWHSVLRVTGMAGGGGSQTWDGTVDLTSLAELNARARNLARTMAAAQAAPTAKAAESKPATKKPAAGKPAAKAAAAKPAKSPAKPVVEAKAKPEKSTPAKPAAKATAKAPAKPAAAKVSAAKSSPAKAPATKAKASAKPAAKKPPKKS